MRWFYEVADGLLFSTRVYRVCERDDMIWLCGKRDGVGSRCSEWLFSWPSILFAHVLDLLSSGCAAPWEGVGGCYASG